MENKGSTLLLKTRRGNTVEFSASKNSIEQILEYKKEMGDSFPKFGVFIISYNASEHIEKTISRIPGELFDAIHEIFLFDDSSPDNTFEIAKKIKKIGNWGSKLLIYQNPKNMGYGGNQKIGYRYALDKGMDYVIMLHGDGQYAPEYIPDFMLSALKDRHGVVFGSRMINKKHALEGGMPFYKFVGNQILTAFENMILGTDLHEFHSGYRMYSTKVLDRIPFEENTDDFHFDSQIICQCKALGTIIQEIPIKTYYGEETSNVNGLRYAKDVCLSVLEYRLHQSHLIRRSRYLVQRKFSFTRKQSPYSSHEKILSKINGPASALSFGDSLGLLAQSLEEKEIETLTLDSTVEEGISSHIKKYQQIDLERPESYSFKREYDYIVFSEIIERIRNAPQVLLHSQNFLKENGKLIISVSNIAIWFYRLSLLIGRFNYGNKGILDNRHVRFYTRATIIQLVERSGYKVLNVDAASLPFEVVFETHGKSKIVKAMDWFYYQLVRLWPGMFAYQYVVTAEITKLNAKAGEGLVRAED